MQTIAKPIRNKGFCKIIRMSALKKKYVAIVFLSVFLMAVSVGVVLLWDSWVDHSFGVGNESSVVSVGELRRIESEIIEYEDEEVREIFPTSAGVILLLDRRLVSLNGADRSEIWSYERTRHIDGILVSGSGSKVVVFLADGLLPWSKRESVVLWSSTGGEADDQFRSPFDAEDFGEGFYFSDLGLMRISGQGVETLVSTRVLGSVDSSWERQGGELCSSGSLDSEAGVDAVATGVNFVLSFTCSVEDGVALQVVMEIDGDSGEAVWVNNWEAPEGAVGNIDVFHLSGATVPWTEADLIGDLVSSDSNAVDYAIMGEGEFVSTYLSYDPALRRIISSPLEDEQERPDLIIVGKASEIEVQILLQASQWLVESDEFSATADDFSLLSLRGDQGPVEAVSYRNWGNDLSPAVSTTLLQDLVRVLGDE